MWVKKSLIPCISTFLAAFCRGLAVVLGWGGVRHSSSRGPAAGLRTTAVSSSVKCLILRRAERPGHLGSMLALAKLSCLIISRAAGVRVHKFSSRMRQAWFLLCPMLGTENSEPPRR